MKIVKGNYGECRFCDNMDEKHGLPSLEEKSWDLCLTDPPYNLKYKSMGCTSKKTKAKKIYYSDRMTPQEYKLWCTQWFQSIKISSKRSVITPGYNNFKMWFNIDQEFEFVIWNNPTKQGECKPAKLTKFEPILTYNIQGNHTQKFMFGIFTIQNEPVGKRIELSHPCPKPFKLWEYITKQLKPSSILDPFMGSGTTAEVCESLGIPWLGYELMKEYSPDIEKRIARGISKKKYATKQQTLF